jgi:hypothetical protein
LPPNSPASQQLQQVRAILIFPHSTTHTTPAQLALQNCTSFPLYQGTSKHPHPHDITIKPVHPWHHTPQHTPFLSLIHFSAMKTLNTYTHIMIIKYNSILHNTTLHMDFLLQDRNP